MVKINAYYITIDDGPFDDFQIRCEFLESVGIRGIWYCQGDKLLDWEEQVVRAIKVGHIIGNHGFSHKKFSEISYEEGCIEITKTDVLIDKLYHQAGRYRLVKTFRFPYLDIGDGATRGKGDLNHWMVKKYQRRLYELGYREPDFIGSIPDSYREFGYNELVSVDLTYDTQDWAIGHMTEDQKKIADEDILYNLKVYCYKNGLEDQGDSYEIILMHSFTPFAIFKSMIQILIDYNKWIDWPKGMKNHHLRAIERGDIHHLEKHHWIMSHSDKKDVEVVFLGDSLTRRWEDNLSVFNTFFGTYKCANYGIGGDNVNNLIWRLDAGELRRMNPKVIVLLIGTNNLFLNDVDEIKEGIFKVISIIKVECPEVRILIHGLLPRMGDKVMMDYTGQISILNKKLQSELPTLCFFIPSDSISSGIEFLDYMPDGLHLNKEGYIRWGTYLEPIIKKYIDYRGEFDEVRSL